MDALRNILVLLDPGAEKQPALDAAIALAKRCGSQLELLICEYQDLHADYYDPMTAILQEFHDSTMAGHRAALERFLKTAAAQDVDAIGEALSGSPFHEVVLARVAATRPDLVVKHSSYHGRIERTLFTGSDWHLIRDCPAPLLLVKDPGKLSGANILACVDPLHSHDKPAALDHQLLASGEFLSGKLGVHLHALHVCSIPAPIGVVGDAYIATVAMPPPQEWIDRARDAYRHLMSAHALPEERVHFRVGVAARDIVDAARELDAGLVVMGAVSRRRLERWFVGSTAESVLDRLPCNVWVEKPVSR